MIPPLMDQMHSSAEACVNCDGSGEARDLANEDWEYVGYPPSPRDCTPLIECPVCGGTGEAPAETGGDV